MAEDYIWVVTDDVPESTRSGGNLRNPYSPDTPPVAVPRSSVPVSAARLEESMADFMQAMGRVLKQAQARAGELGSLELDEVTLSVEVNGEGQLSLLGSGAKAGASGGITLHFKKASSK
ncbi:MAG: hypothetical protein ICV77_13470 [Cyanobacteria bacterium Co-bin8]|nr:hypothetical protein [Cyanobacteria bacterium Co-bin8]